MNPFKVLILYPNGKLMNPPPISIGIFTALLKKNNIEVDLFDTTFYEDTNEKYSDEAKEENLQVRPFDDVGRGAKIKKTSMEDDLVKQVQNYNPNLIFISILECTYATSVLMLKALEHFDIPILAGGIFATFGPEIVLANKNVNMLCVGEGEGTIVDLCLAIRDGKDIKRIKNLWIKDNGRIIKNPLHSIIDINKLPIPDYSLFDKNRFYRPMAGKIYRTIPIETNRGCPYSCSFCNSPSTAKLYKKSDSRFFRSKRMDIIQKELKSLVKNWDAEYIYFTSDNFLIGKDSVFDEFVEIYKDFKLPFWIQVRLEVVTESRMQKLKDVGCHRMSIGLEHGNEIFRRDLLNKKFKNKQAIRASEIIAKVGIPLTINNMIGFPDETRELLFDTIELNRKMVSDTTNCAVFAPFHGTPLQKLCVEKGYISNDYVFGSINTEAPLDMPQLSREEITGLRRTFAMYVGLERNLWPEIKKAETFDEEGNYTFKELSEIYRKKYFS